MKKETEGLIVAAQDRSLRTNVWRAKIEKANASPMCRMCGAAEETVFHLVSECSVMAQNDYKGRHNKVAKIIHWDICKEKGVEVQYKHQVVLACPKKGCGNCRCQDSLGLQHSD